MEAETTVLQPQASEGLMHREWKRPWTEPQSHRRGPGPAHTLISELCLPEVRENTSLWLEAIGCVVICSRSSRKPKKGLHDYLLNE